MVWIHGWPRTYVTPIPEAVASDDAAPLLCGGVTAYAALRKTRAISGDWVVISGSGGGIGHLACQMGSKAMGYRILGIDHKPRGIHHASAAQKSSWLMKTFHMMAMR